MKAIVGLGNPGARYKRTRHNLGWRVIETFGHRRGAGKARRVYHAHVSRVAFAGEEVLLVRPTTYMNLSGKAVLSVMAAKRIRPEELIIVADDIHLAVGQLRIRPGGSSGGHKGLASIIEVLGNARWPRLRIGVGEPPRGAEQTDYVLENPPAEEKKILDEAVERAADALELWLNEGIERCMSVYNSGKGIR